MCPGTLLGPACTQTAHGPPAACACTQKQAAVVLSCSPTLAPEPCCWGCGPLCQPRDVLPPLPTHISLGPAPTGQLGLSACTVPKPPGAHHMLAHALATPPKGVCGQRGASCLVSFL